MSLFIEAGEAYNFTNKNAFFLNELKNYAPVENVCVL